MAPLTPQQRIEMDEHDYNVSGLLALGHHPGAMWRWPEHDIEGRECWVVVLPNRAGAWWTTYKSDPEGLLWEVTGIPPSITVHPSINAGDGPGPGNWHGWIKAGVLTP